MTHYAGIICSYCKSETDGNGDCAYYCEDGYCGKCGQEVPRNINHICKGNPK